MNVHVPFDHREPLRLRADAFWALKQAGAFAGFSKCELLDGEISGVPMQDENEPESDASVPIKLRRQDYAFLDRLGMLDGHGKTELIDGLVYPMSPQYRRHGYIKDELAYRLRRALENGGTSLRVATEQSVAIDTVSEPQPDIIVTREPRGDGPIPADSVALLVEVSVHTARFDLDEKVRLYSGGGIPEYWVADVNARIIHQMWMPQGSAFDERRQIAFGDRIALATIGAITIDTADL